MLNSAVLALLPVFVVLELPKLMASPGDFLASPRSPLPSPDAAAGAVGAAGDSLAGAPLPLFIWVEFAVVCVCGGLVSLLLVAVQVKIVTLTSSLTTEVIAKVRDMLQVAMAVLVYGDSLTPRNAVGMVVLLVGVLSYSFFKQSRAAKETTALERLDAAYIPVGQTDNNCAD